MRAPGVLALLGLSAALLAGCVPRVVPWQSRPPDLSASATGPGKVPAEVRRAVRIARRLLGRERLGYRGRDFRDDCSGFVTGCFAVAGVGLIEPGTPGQSATQMIHDSLASVGLVFVEGAPRVGDLVFFHDSWDSNGDGQRGDRFTHVGVVERVDPSGVVTFLHFATRAVRRARLDPSRPHLRQDPSTGEIVNDWLRRKSYPGEGGLLAGELFAAWGRPHPGLFPPDGARDR